ncbi:tetratricopeptide repeat protein [Agathobacter sp.]
MTKNKYIALALTAALTAGMLAGCGSSDKSKDKDAYRQYGINCIENGNYDDAVDAFQKALNQSVGSVGEEELDICYYKAKAQYLSGDADGAMETYTAIIDYNGDSDAYYLRGCLYFAQNDSDKGMADFKKALKDDSKNYELYIGVYETLSKYGMADQGNEYLQEALKLEAKKADDFMQVGRIYTILGDYDKAVDNLQKAIDEKLVKANYYMGEAYQKKGDNDSAQQYFQTYLDSGEADTYDLMNMGQSQMDDGNYDTAITYFQTALDMESVPNKQQIMKAMIIAYEYSGDFATAKSQMEEYMKEFPDDQDASREYQFLETR